MDSQVQKMSIIDQHAEIAKLMRERYLPEKPKEEAAPQLAGHSVNTYTVSPEALAEDDAGCVLYGGPCGYALMGIYTAPATDVA